jgi:hypothetical protein
MSYCPTPSLSGGPQATTLGTAIKRTLWAVRSEMMLGYFVVLILEILQAAFEFVSVFLFAFLESIPEGALPERLLRSQKPDHRRRSH